jgi:hypothetical protein
LFLTTQNQQQGELPARLFSCRDFFPMTKCARPIDALVNRFHAILPGIPHPSNSQLVMDALAHELDLREALGLECDESSLALSVAKAWLLGLIQQSRTPWNPDRGGLGRHPPQAADVGQKTDTCS